MYQSVLRDPGGDSIVRILTGTTIVDGSILIVPADTVAFFMCNGLLSEQYPSGRYEIHTGVSPFFVRLRNLMTQGDPGISVSVFFVNNRLESVLQAGTGGIVFREKRFNISLKAMAAYTVRYVISEPYMFLQQLVGMHREVYYAEDIQPAIESMLCPCVREEIAKYLSRNDVHEFQNELVEMGSQLLGTLQGQFRQYGITLRAVCLTAINVPDSELAKLQALEEKYAGGIVETDVELDNIKRVYGDVNTRTFTEVATGSVRGPASNAARHNGFDASGNMANMMVALPIQMAMANQVLNSMSGSINDLMNRSNVSQSGTGVVPDLPVQRRACCQCGRQLEVRDIFCKYCGAKQ